jgi:formate hydrogenlyase subunit 6/NADH:ubiquinone oxidoreductase subunit I
MLRAELANAIDGNFQAFRQAIEQRRYPEAQALLGEQRKLFKQLDLEDSQACELCNKACELTNWALTLAHVQHAHTERAFASLLKLKQLDAGYLPSAVCAAELVSVRG